MKNKRGISPLVATVLILAITLAAGLMLYNLVMPLVKVPTQEVKCQDVSFRLDKPASCIDTTPPLPSPECSGYANEIKISVDRTKSKSDEPDITEWNIVLDAETGKRKTLREPATGEWDIPEGKQKTPVLCVSSTDTTEIGGNVVNIELYPTIKVKTEEIGCAKFPQELERLSSC